MPPPSSKQMLVVCHSLFNKKLDVKTPVSLWYYTAFDCGVVAKSVNVLTCNG